MPAALVVLGLVLFATNLGLISPDIWPWLLRLWPAVLILLGLELLLTGRASWRAALFLVLVLLIAGGLGAGRSFFSLGGSPRFPVPPPPTHSAALDQPLGGAREAEVTASFAAGEVSITGGADAGLLAQGNTTPDERGLESSYRVAEGVGRLELREISPGSFGATQSQTNLRLTSAIPLRSLQVRVGASQLQADLNDLQLRAFDLQVGATQATVRLPARGTVNALIRGGASTIVVDIPTEMAADIRIDSGLTRVKVDETRFPSSSPRAGIPMFGFQNSYRSSNFGSAENKISLRIQTGASSVEIR
ncbi:MAG: hypothetical protein EXR58_05260 [Chloroflexi bacterium]|nr:hypothetical protein [Chloroflexota bacterium]